MLKKGYPGQLHPGRLFAHVMNDLQNYELSFSRPKSSKSVRLFKRHCNSRIFFIFIYSRRISWSRSFHFTREEFRAYSLNLQLVIVSKIGSKVREKINYTFAQIFRGFFVLFFNILMLIRRIS